MPPKPPGPDPDPAQLSTTMVPHLQEFLNTVPPPLTTVLVGLSPHINRIRHLLQVVNWKSTWYESWLLLAGWWAVCLCAEVTLRYLLPLTVAGLVLFLRRIRTRSPPIPPPPITEQHLQQTISSLSVIHALLQVPSPTSFASDSLPQPRPLLRLMFSLYPFYLLLTFFVPLRILLGIAGSLVLTWRSPWFSIIRRSLWRSAHFRWASYRLYSILSGDPLPPSISSLSNPKYRLTKNDANTNETHARFLFSLHENQRWWISLDWTSALLPSERPPWSSPPPHFLPLPPPSSFPLPADRTVYTELADEGRKGGKKKRVKRHAQWSWEESEWKVVMRKEGAGGVTRVEKEVPAAEGSSTASNATKILKSVVNRREGSSGGQDDVSIELAEQERKVKREVADTDGSRSRSASRQRGLDEEGREQGGGTEETDEPFTDPDGWIYGDNKWENPSGKGGMGKYTRYRRWTRVAVLTETVEPVEDDEPQLSITPNANANPTIIQPHRTHAQPESAEKGPSSNLESGEQVEVRGDGEHEHGGSLRQRLKAAVKKGSGTTFMSS